jgi:hypothetical protein
MKRHPYILLLLSVFPLLLANSPSPYAGAMPYDDFTYTQITIDPHPTLPNQYVYETTLTNNGSGYIALDDIEFISFTNANERMVFQNSLMGSHVLKPLDAFNVTVTHPRYVDDFMIESVNAYTIVVDEVLVTVHGPLSLTPNAPSPEVNIPVTYSGDRDFTYSAIVNLTIETVPYSFITTEVTNTTIYLTLEQFSNEVLNDLTIESIVLIRGRANTQGISLWTIALGFMTVVSVVAGALTIAAVSGIILFLSKRLLKKQRRP